MRLTSKSAPVALLLSCDLVIMDAAQVQEPLPAVVQLPPEVPGEVENNAENNAENNTERTPPREAAQQEPTAEELH